MSKADAKGNHHLHIELTPEQYQMLTEKARQCGLTRRALILRLLEGKEVRARPSDEIKALRTEIHHVGNNINQIARRINAGIASAGEAKRALYLLDQVYELLYEAVKREALASSSQKGYNGQKVQGECLQ